MGTQIVNVSLRPISNTKLNIVKFMSTENCKVHGTELHIEI